MSLARKSDGGGMSVQAFRAFQMKRPDEERWELIDGQPVMMTPPFLIHQVIAGNLQRLLDGALAPHDEQLLVIQRPGVELGLAADAFRAMNLRSGYVPEPDVAVIRDTDDPAARYALSVVLFAEVVSSTDRAAKAEGRAWIEVKAGLYRAHRDCEAVLIVEQERVGIHLWQRGHAGWTEAVLSDLDEELAVAGCGLRCRVADIYARTHLGRPPGP